VTAALLLTFFSWTHGGDGVHLQGQDYSATFLVVGMLAVLSVFSFRTLRHDEGAGLR
jgi:hypothetical protein